MITTSDGFGIVGSLLLLAAPAQDLYLRFRAARSAEKAKQYQGLSKIFKTVGDAFNEKRNEYKPWEALTMFFGALCLLISYVL